MTSSALIDTTNRLLGSSINDFGLYGGQIAVAIGAPAAPSRLSDGLTVPDPASASTSAAPTGSAPASPAHADESRAIGEPQGDAPGGFHSTPFAPAPIQFGDPVHANAFEFQAPAAMGSGFSAAPMMDAPHAAAMVPTAMPTGLTPPTLATESPEIATPAIAALGGLAAPVLGLGEALDPQALDHVVSAVAATADALVDEGLQAIDALPQVSEIVAADGFLGSDPVGGVATLVSMVDSTDAFDLAHAGVDVAEAASAGSILDTLADETVAGALLGDVGHDVDSLLPDHQHDGASGLI